MAPTYEELKHMTVADLRDLAKDLDHEAVEGYTQLNKDHLIPALCKAYGIDTHEHHDGKHNERYTRLFIRGQGPHRTIRLRVMCRDRALRALLWR